MTGMFHGNGKPLDRRDPLRNVLFSALLLATLTIFSKNLHGNTLEVISSPELFSDTVKQKISNIQKSRKFYDSIYHKFHRNKFAMFLYDLTFVVPPEEDLPAGVQNVKSEVPFMKYKGKVIRNIEIRSLDPFGPTLIDNNARPLTGVGKALNKVHITTREYIIRRQILFKTGELVDPVRIADNLRILRDLSSINTARILITQPDPENDSVDITVITQDVWSIGFDVPVIASNRVVFRLYDANFLGQGDRFSNTFSIVTKRAPFFRYDGGSYTYTNIGGSFIDANAHFSQDDDWNQNIGGGLGRAFFATTTRWAGGAGFEYNRSVNILSDTTRDIAYFTDQNIWLGLAFLLKNRKVPTRFVISEAVYWRDYSSSPPVTLDSNRSYYDRLQLFTGIAISRNNYYIADYVFRFGVPENIPYGRLFQVTLGHEWTNFYKRYYAGITLSGGDYIKSSGYLSASIKLGGYIYKYSVEDAVLKVGMNYMTPLFPGRSSRYMFRSFLTGDYKLGFNFRSNNTGYANINQDFQIRKYQADTLFHGVQLLAVNLRLIMYAPWFFYGFRFAVMLHLQGGFIAKDDEPLFTRSFYSGIGAGIFIRNDNLIFPTVTISLYFYPNHPAGVPSFQVNFLENATYSFQDFNVTNPHAETLDN